MQPSKNHKTNIKTQKILQSKICKDLNLFKSEEENTTEVALSFTSSFNGQKNATY